MAKGKGSSGNTCMSGKKRAKAMKKKRLKNPSRQQLAKRPSTRKGVPLHTGWSPFDWSQETATLYIGIGRASQQMLAFSFTYCILDSKYAQTPQIVRFVGFVRCIDEKQSYCIWIYVLLFRSHAGLSPRSNVVYVSNIITPSALSWDAEYRR